MESRCRSWFGPGSPAFIAANKRCYIARILTTLIAACGCKSGSGGDELGVAIAAITTESPSQPGGDDGNGHRLFPTHYLADCNDPDTYDPTCVHPNEAAIANLRALGYPYYIGHAEPMALFFSTLPNSASNMQWSLQLPATDPTPTQNGSSVANFEVFTAQWIGLVVCDPTSIPSGSCVPASDSNVPSTAGAALMELQLNPPGGTSGNNKSDTQWTFKLTIWSLHYNAQCGESVAWNFLTTNGMPLGPVLLMSNGDSVVVTIKDTASGLQTSVVDLTSGASGSMVASAANGFVHNANTTDCQTAPFTFHPMYATATADHFLPWGANFSNVSFTTEFGHWELCGNASCSILPDGDGDDTVGCTTVRGIGGCTGGSPGDTDFDGLGYQPNWPDGTSSHPGSIFIGASNSKGVGPLSASPTDATKYTQGYGTIAFATSNANTSNFYPFFTQAGTGFGCRFTFGNDIPGTTTNDFAKAAQYGQSITNPCVPDLRWLVPALSPLM